MTKKLWDKRFERIGRSVHIVVIKGPPHVNTKHQHAHDLSICTQNGECCGRLAWFSPKSSGQMTQFCLESRHNHRVSWCHHVVRRPNALVLNCHKNVKNARSRGGKVRERRELPFKEISSGVAAWPCGRPLVDLSTSLFCSRRYSTEKGMSALLASKISYICQKK